MIKKIKKIVSFLLFLICMFLYIKVSNYYNFEIDCIFYKLTGLYCPGCGITRMFESLFNLKFYQAFRFNPLVFVLLILFIIYLIIGLFISKPTLKKINKIIIYPLLLIIVIYGILRNFPTFSYLIPTQL